jgi:RNA polymerase sporulation-specific sigma factor
MYLRKERGRIKSELSLRTPVMVDVEGNESTIEDAVPSEVNIEKIICEKEFVNITLQLMRNLPYKQRTIAVKRIIQKDKNITQRDIQKKLGISKSYVSRIERKVLKNLRSQLSKEGYTDI